MVESLSIAEAREQLTRLPEQFEKEPELTVQVTRYGKPVMAVLSWELYEAITETLDILADPDMMAALRRSAQEIARGETIAWEDVKAEMGA